LLFALLLEFVAEFTRQHLEERILLLIGIHVGGLVSHPHDHDRGRHFVRHVDKGLVELSRQLNGGRFIGAGAGAGEDDKSQDNEQRRPNCSRSIPFHSNT